MCACAESAASGGWRGDGGVAEAVGGYERGGENGDALCLQHLPVFPDEGVFPVPRQRREYRVVVVPAPSLAEQQCVFERTVGAYVAVYGVDVLLCYGIYEGVHVVGVEKGVHASPDNDVSDEDILLLSAVLRGCVAVCKP